MALKLAQVALLAVTWVGSSSMPLAAQTTAPATSTVPHQSGTVKSVEVQSFVLTTAAGQEVTVTVPGGTAVLLVQPGSHDLKSAQAGTVADIAAGDRAIVNGSNGDAGVAMQATRVIVMKSGAIAASRASEQAAWAKGLGGIVRSVDLATGVMVLSSGLRTVTVSTSAATTVQRYAGGSVRFEDAVVSSLGAIRPGDQVRVRGTRGAAGANGETIVADAIVAGSFSNFSGLLTAVDPATGTVTLKDLASKKTVSVAVTSASNVRRLPAGAAQAMASREAGTGAGTGAASSAPAGAPTAGAGGGQNRAGGAGSGGAAGPGGAGRPGGGMGGDLSRMVTRLPPETLANLKPGDAVMIVASNGEGSGQPTAITLLAGVEQILAAHPTGGTMLSPWNLGGGEGVAEPGGEPR